MRFGPAHDCGIYIREPPGTNAPLFVQHSATYRLFTSTAVSRYLVRFCWVLMTAGVRLEDPTEGVLLTVLRNNLYLCCTHAHICKRLRSKCNLRPISGPSMATQI